MANLDYYDYGPIESYNAQYMLIAGARGLGKTFGAKQKCLDDWFKKRKEFFLLRRYDEEKKKASRGFFTDIAHLYPHADFRSNGSIAQVASAETRGMKKREWDTLGHFGALSQEQQHHGTPYPNVKRMIFDEAILHKGGGQYIPSELEALNNMYNTVSRGRSEVKLYLLANSVSIANPYFIGWNINPEDGREFQVFWRNADRSPFGVVHLPESERYQQQVRQTNFGRFLEQTSPEYAEYAIGNKFRDATDERVAKKSPDSKYRFTLVTRSQTVSFWYDVNTRLFYCTARRPKSERLFVIDRTQMSPGRTYLEYGSKILSSVRTAWNHDRILFDSPNTRNLFLDVFKR